MLGQSIKNGKFSKNCDDYQIALDLPFKSKYFSCKVKELFGYFADILTSDFIGTFFEKNFILFTHFQEDLTTNKMTIRRDSTKNKKDL